MQILAAPSLRRFGWLVHGFSTRPGGASELRPAGDARKIAQKVLNLGFATWDSRDRVLENRQRFYIALGAPSMRVVTLDQFHSDIVHVIGSSSTLPAEPPRGDALVTSERGVLLVVQTADCVPILLADPKRRAVAAIHAGWRGTLARIPEKTLGRMRMEFRSEPADVVAALGPAIGRCCYEVGPEVVKEFQAQFPQARDWFGGPIEALASGEDVSPLPWLNRMPPGHRLESPRARLDLLAANRAILCQAGVLPQNICSSDFCAACRNDLFFSYRRERTTGRMMAAIGIR